MMMSWPLKMIWPWARRVCGGTEQKANLTIRSHPQKIRANYEFLGFLITSLDEWKKCYFENSDVVDVASIASCKSLCTIKVYDKVQVRSADTTRNGSLKAININNEMPWGGCKAIPRIDNIFSFRVIFKSSARRRLCCSLFWRLTLFPFVHEMRVKVK